MSKSIFPVLEAIGLSQRESALYLTGLKLGNAPASHYAQKTGLNRITAYNVLEDLTRRGYFSKEKHLRSQCYTPVSPEYLSIETRKRADALQRILPDLKALQGRNYHKPKVRFYEGWEGVKHVYDDTLTAEGELLNFTHSSAIRDIWPNYDEEYVRERVRRGIYLRGISPDDATGRKVHGKDEDFFREIRLISAKEYDFTNEINIYDHKVATCSFSNKEDMFGIIIESDDFARSQRQIFEMAWKYAGVKK